MSNPTSEAGYLPDTLGEAIAVLAHTQQHRTALKCNDSSVSFDALNVSACRVGNGLLALQTCSGDRVVIIGQDSIANYEILLGCAKIGCIATPLNWRLSGSELSFAIRDSKARIAFLDDPSLKKLELSDPDLLVHLQTLSLDHIETWKKDYACTEPLDSGVSTESPAIQIYTSGTLGKPKGVVLPHRTFFTLLEQMRSKGNRWMDLTDEDVLLLSLPQFHIGGLWWAVQGLLAGACGILMESFTGWKALNLIEDHKITKVAMVPAMIQFTLSEPDALTADLSSVTGFLYGGSPISGDLLQKAIDRFACPFFQIYGLTETGNMAVCLWPEDHQDPMLRSATGKPLPGVELKITDEHSVPLGVNQIGEVWIKSPSVMLEYWNNREATQETLHQGWIRTGDAGYINTQGYLYICDRIKDLVIYAGENVYPAEIESVLNSHPGIIDSAVIGIPDDQFGELVLAFLVSANADNKPSSRVLIRYCSDHLAAFKIPKKFVFLDSIPRNASGKTLKNVLRRPYWNNYSRQVN